MQVEYPSLETLGTNNVLDSIFFFFEFWNICTYKMAYLEAGTQVKIRNLCMFHKPSAHSLMIISCNNFSTYVLTKMCYMSSGYIMSEL